MATNSENPIQRTPFAVALTFFLDKGERGTAASLARKVGVSPPYISELASGRKVGKEDKRRAVASALGISYESFLHLGRLLLSGVPGEEALEQARRTIFGVGNVTLPGFKIRGEATNTPPASGGTIRQVGGKQEKATYSTVCTINGRPVLVEATKEQLHKLRDGVYMVERDDPFDSLTGPAMDSLRDWWRKKHGDTHNSAAQFVMELGRRFPEMSPVVQITGDKPPGGGQGK